MDTIQKFQRLESETSSATKIGTLGTKKNSEMTKTKIAKIPNSGNGKILLRLALSNSLCRAEVCVDAPHPLGEGFVPRFGRFWVAIWSKSQNYTGIDPR